MIESGVESTREHREASGVILTPRGGHSLSICSPI